MLPDGYDGDHGAGQSEDLVAYDVQPSQYYGGQEEENGPCRHHPEPGPPEDVEEAWQGCSQFGEPAPEIGRWAGGLHHGQKTYYAQDEKDDIGGPARTWASPRRRE